MQWVEQWDAIRGRIEGLLEAASFLAKASGATPIRDGAKKIILPELTELKSEIERFRSEHGKALPAIAATALDEFLSETLYNESTGNKEINLIYVAAFAAFRSRFEYLSRDREREGRSITELAFEHLQRLIVVDEVVRERWLKAFNNDETACEKLGAVHLLSHGIWAFKVSTVGAATDLVYADPVDSFRHKIQRVARALVLTEWKRVQQPCDSGKMAEVARRQSKDYAAGALGDVELQRTRYVVLVGQHKQNSPEDVELNGITYRHIWIAAGPDVPSVAARRSQG